ncbi:hypothetical protein BV25DRAFT_1921767 [Artomyces pyxidatus]|uniref:Uncharacterized protein n=1 Tax=Artomyces pyxidatus TaxID=48021 RepID=A0ACB8SGW7_9AGAM|nr:hypothetical protein BV25DRAFT_1921767 [Artomyces pyxidatus]
MSGANSPSQTTTPLPGAGTTSQSSPTIPQVVSRSQCQHIGTACSSAATTSFSNYSFGTSEGKNWKPWSSKFIGLLHMFEIEELLNHDNTPTGVDLADWKLCVSRMIGFLQMNIEYTIWITIQSPIDFPTICSKWLYLQKSYEKEGSTAIFNSWVAMTQTC